MGPQLVMMESSRLCNSCGRKIRKGMSAIAVHGEQVFFCNTECLKRNSDNFDSDNLDDEDYD